jgi:hypothetical protein
MATEFAVKPELQVRRLEEPWCAPDVSGLVHWLLISRRTLASLLQREDPVDVLVAAARRSLESEAKQPNAHGRLETVSCGCSQCPSLS